MSSDDARGSYAVRSNTPGRAIAIMRLKIARRFYRETRPDDGLTAKAAKSFLKLILNSYLSKGRRPANFERCRSIKNFAHDFSALKFQ